MKVCIIGNSSINVKKWIELYASWGINVLYITYSHIPDKFIQDEKYVSIFKLKTIRFKKSILLQFGINFFYYYIQIRKLLKDYHGIIQTCYVDHKGLLAILQNKRPQIFSIFGSDIFVNSRNPLINIYLKILLKFPDMLVVTNDYATNFLVNNFGVNKLRIIKLNMGIDLVIFKKGYVIEVENLRKNLGIEENTIVIFSNRSMSSLYNTNVIVDSIPKVLKKYHNVFFIFISLSNDLKYKNYMLNKISKLNKLGNNRVFVINKIIESHEMALFLNLSDIFISIPSTDQFGSSVKEGMACGSIPILSNINVYKTYISDYQNGYFVNHKSSDDLSIKIIYAIEHIINKDKIFQINKKIIYENENMHVNKKKIKYILKNLSNKSL